MLSRLLEKEQPGIITVEVSLYARNFRRRESSPRRSVLRENLKRIAREDGRSLRETILHPAIKGIFFLLRDPFEWRAAAAYAATRKEILLKAIDLSIYSREKLGHIGELIAVENLRVLLGTPVFDLRREAESVYRRARALFLHPPAAWTASEETRTREAHMARVIRSLVRRANGRKVLHIGGWEHLVEAPGGESLWGRLKDLRPERKLLGDITEEDIDEKK